MEQGPAAAAGDNSLVSRFAEASGHGDKGQKTNFEYLKRWKVQLTLEETYL